MSRQQSRASGDGAIDPSLVQKKRARHRLVGAVCLCILAAIVVPMVLESEPRPRHQELPIELAAAARDGDGQARHQAATSAGTPAPGTPAASGPSAGGAEPGAAARSGGAVTSGQIGNFAGRQPGGASSQGTGSAESQSAVKTVTPPSAPGAAQAVPPPAARDPRSTADTAKAEPPRSGSASQAARQEAARQEAAKQEAAKQEAGKQDAAKQEAARQEAARQAAKQDSSKAGTAGSKPSTPDKPAAREPDVLARLIERSDDGSAAAKAAASRKFLVQIGAYSNVQSAKTASDRASQLGLRPYQETVKTTQGDWIRVRIGPFTTRQDAERAQQDLKRAGVTAAIIAL